MDIAGRGSIQWRKVWDLCSGSGAVGLEALSWGAERCVFVDLNSAALAFTRAFLKKSGAEDRGVTIRDDFRRYISREERCADLVFIDPPYNSGELYEWIDENDWSACVGRGGIVFAEAGLETVMRSSWKSRKYGSSVLYWKWIE